VVDDYLSEREQIDRVRGWVKENAPWAVAGVLLGVGLLVGWQQFQSWRTGQAQQASQKYEQTLEALSRGDRDAANTIARQLKSDYARTPYADMAELALARFYVEDGKLPEAAKYLQDVVDTSKDEELKLVARLRLARVQRAQGNLDAALATLNGAQPGGFAPAYAEVRGDVLYDKGDRAGALAAYREAAAATTPGLVDAELVQLKIDELAGTAATATTASAGAPPAAGTTGAPTGATPPAAAGARP
jgi:predicted negative regulator of RcsB-dependent stress response